jgi:epoxyqueuosine reductase
MKTLFARIKDFCLAQGFDLVAGIRPHDYQHFDIFQKWVRSGKNADMQYLSSERSMRLRQSPYEIMPTCHTILVLVKRYPPAVKQSSKELAIASYALGDDYHRTIPPVLEEIVKFIREQSGHELVAKAFTDTAAILERELACQAGLGWIGKNSCLINPKIGSFFLLAEIFLDLDVLNENTIPSPLPDHCGTCRRCIENCPTQCIQEDRTLDASRCISYLTIENKGLIPRELRSKIGNHLFGCDVCQQVCPWNREHLDPAVDMRLPISIQEIRSRVLDEDEFRRLFRNSPIKRPKQTGFYRNLAVTLGNLRDETDLTILDRLLHDGDPLVRRHAAWALGQFHLPQSMALLNSALEHESDPAVRAEIYTALE